MDSENLLYDVSVNLIVTIIAFLFGIIFAKFWHLVKIRHAKKVLGPFLKGNLQIVVGRFLGNFVPFEPTGLFGVGDAMGLAEFQTYLESLGVHNIPVSYADYGLRDKLKSNLIILGGPDVNEISKDVMAKLNPKIRFGDPSSHEIAIYDSSSNKHYVPRWTSQGDRITTDYGIILKTSNPFTSDSDKQTQIILIAGSFGYGTWAGVRFIMSKMFLENPLVSGGKSIECLIETDVVDDTPQDIRLINIREHTST